MLERLVIHIGMHKTGSTSIQRSLVDARDALLARGVLYPRAGWGFPGHNALTRELRNTDVPVAELPSHLRLLEEVERERPAIIVISSEVLSYVVGGRGAVWARHLEETLRPRRLQVIGYVRPQWEAVESMYSQAVKGGRMWSTFDEYVERRIERATLDYPERFRPWRDGFGERLELHPYRGDLLRGGDVVADFWTRTGLGTPADTPHRVNPRLGARTLELLRLLRAVLANHRLDPLVPVPELTPTSRQEEQERALQAVAIRARRRIEAELGPDKPFAALTRELAERVVADWAAANERFVAEYMGGRHRDLFAPPDELPEVSTWSLSEASYEERRFFARLVAGTLSELRSDSHEAGRPGPGAAPAALSSPESEAMLASGAA